MKTAWPGRSNGLFLKTLRKVQRDEGRLGIVFVLDVRKDIDSVASPASYPILPLPALRVAIFRTAQSDIGESGRQFHRRRVIIRIVDAKRHVVLPKQPINVIHKPGIVSKLKSRRNTSRKDGEKHLQPLEIAFKEGRQLIEDHTQTTFQT